MPLGRQRRGAGYSQLEIGVNGNLVGYSITENPNVAGNLLPYTYHQIWLPQALNAGDVVQTWGFASVTCTYFGAASWPGDGIRVMYDSPLSDVT